MVIAVLGSEINLNSVSGWYVPKPAEIARGVNPHFKIMSGDSEQCIAAKQLFNSSVSNALGASQASGGLGLVSEVVRIKEDLNRAKTEIRQNCKSKFDGTFQINPGDFDKYLN
jgi:hypothetical protein